MAPSWEYFDWVVVENIHNPPQRGLEITGSVQEISQHSTSKQVEAKRLKWRTVSGSIDECKQQFLKPFP